MHCVCVLDGGNVSGDKVNEKMQIASLHASDFQLISTCLRVESQKTIHRTNVDSYSSPTICAYDPPNHTHVFTSY